MTVLTLFQQHQAICTNPCMPIAKRCNLLGIWREAPLSVVDQYKIVPGAVHFCKEYTHQSRIT
jgi:hypothetical protein